MGENDALGKALESLSLRITEMDRRHHETHIKGEEYSSDIDKWQPKSYAETSIVYNKNCQYQANCRTSEEWVRYEWNLITGAEQYVSGQNYHEGDRVITHNLILKALTDTSSELIAQDIAILSLFLRI